MSQEYDPNQAFKREQKRVEHQTATQAGADRARSSGFDPQELMSEEWMDTVNDLDVDRDLPDEHPAQHNVEKKLGAHTSKQFGIGYISREEYEEENLKDRGRRRLMNSGFRRRGGSGAKCTGRTRERMTGDESDERPLMDADLSDQLDAGFEAKRMQRSGSVGGRRFKGSTEVQVVTKNESGFDLDGGGSGWASKLTGGLLG
jgi:hypothetical protein